MEHMMLKKGDMVKPRVHRKRYKGGTLAIVTNVKTSPQTGIRDNLQILWLDGGFRGYIIWDYPDLFEKVTERNHA